MELPETFGLSLLLIGSFCLAVNAQQETKQAAEFERDIKPILARRCSACHSSQSKSSGLVVETQERLLEGGSKNGAAIVPGNSLDSPLIQYLRGEKRPAMPLGQKSLPENEISLIAQWIDAMKVQRKENARGGAHRLWPFTKLEKPVTPRVSDAGWLRNGIDTFVLAKQEEKGLTPAPSVSKRVLLRRLSFDLIGLPPTPEEVDRFLNDGSPQAYEREVDRLLADRRYGERWGRHWLDIVRYADSTGGGLDFPLPHMWRYRDYVVRAFNEDRSYDRIVREHIAGDAYPRYGEEGKIGTGFLRLGVTLEGTPEEMRRELLIDVVGTTGSVFLGLTLACARCHDHKFDSIPTREYYQIEAFFAPVTIQPQTVSFTQYENGSEWQRRDKEWVSLLEKRKEQQEQVMRAFREKVQKAMRFVLSNAQDLKDQSVPFGDEDVAVAMRKGIIFTKEERELYALVKRAKLPGHWNNLERYRPLAYAAAEFQGSSNSPGPNYPVAPATHVLAGGNMKLKGEVVGPGFLSEANWETEPINFEGVQQTRRKLLAEWIGSSKNPLTARVMVNRIWQHHFGEGLVTTPSDFGKNGGGAVHQDLIDWLASEFIEGGWSIKKMHRLMLTSNTYRQAMANPRAEEYERIDPEHRYLWQMNRLRLEAEAIRDTILSVSGELNPAMGGPAVFPEVDEELKKRGGVWWEPSSKVERNRRSLYILQQRSLELPLIKVFDGTNLNESCAVRGVTTVTPQVLGLFNSKFIHEQSQAMSQRIIREVGTNPESQIDRAFDLALQRAPSEEERAKSLEFSRHQGLTDFCLVLMNLNEFIFLE